jgi:tRNA A-37 threonylcarbamoyl transferase component Bud32
MMRLPLQRPYLVPLVFALLVLGAGWLLYTRVDARLRRELASDLTTIRDSNVAALNEWIAAQERAARTAAADAEVLQSAERLLRQTRQDAQHTRYLRQELRRLLQPVVRHNEFTSFVIARGQRVLASDQPEPWGPLPEPVVDVVSRLPVGQAWLSPPHLRPEPDADAPPSDQESRPALRPVMWTCSPLPTSSEQEPGSLCFTLDPRRSFARVLRLAQFGRTGETYAFGPDGFFLSRSRFEKELREWGLLGPGQTSLLRIQVRDPGTDLEKNGSKLTAPAERPLTRMARSAVRGERGVDVDGYTGYRGTPVVGAWVWIAPHQFGVATEMEVSEAYETLRVVRTSLWALFGILVLATLGLAGGASVIQRLQGTARRAERLGQYTLEERIGQGGMGTVYRAQHALLRRPTALKVIRSVELDSATRVRFEREVQATSQLTHPNTVAIYDYGHAAGGIFYYAMEYLDGITLQELVRSDGAQPQARVLHILEQVCGSLAEAHAAGLVHRDVKPANIMLCRRGGMYDVVKVLDFGLVKAIDSGESLLTAANALAGTPHYMAPEYITEPASADARSDVYAVAAVAFYLLTARLLFDGGNMVSVLTRHMTEEPPRPSTITPEPVAPALEQLLLTCLDKDPARRPKDAGALLEELERLELDVGVRWTQREASAWWHARAELGRPERVAPFTTAPTLAVDLRGRFGSARRAGTRPLRERRRQPEFRQEQEEARGESETLPTRPVEDPRPRGERGPDV